MEALAITNTMVQAQSISVDMMDDFIRFIDRSEKTAQTYCTNLRAFVAWMRYASVTQPTRQDVLAYKFFLSAEHDAIKLDNSSLRGWNYQTDGCGNPLRTVCKPNTVAQYLRSVCAFFKWTAANGLYPDIAAGIHAPKIRHDAHKKDALTVSDVLTIENSITAQADAKAAAAGSAAKDSEGRKERATEQGLRLRAMYLLAVNAGLRTIELERANIRDLEVKGGAATLYVWGKGHSEADTRKPLAAEVYQAIKAYLDARTDKPTAASPLFVSTGNRSKGKRIAARTISQMLKQAMQAAGFDSERLTAHSLRHTAGTAVMELSNDLYTTQRYMRHSNPATTEIYLHTDTERKEAQLAQQLYNLYHGTAAQQ